LRNIFQALWPLQAVLKNNPPSKTNKEQKENKEAVLLRQGEETYVKELIYSKPEGLIVYKTNRRQGGRKHDYKVYKKNHPDLPEDVMSMYDLGFLGVEKDYQKQKSSLPIKKEKDHELTVQQKEYNKNHSTKRIVIEHAICRLKKYRIMNDIFRNRLRKYNKVSDIVSGLVNYRIMNSY
jgi:hypothetical protein